MPWFPTKGWSRITFLRTLLIAPMAAVLAACTSSQESSRAAANPSPTTAADQAIGRLSPSGSASHAVSSSPTGSAAPVLQATPACTDEDDEPTPAQTEG